MTDLKNIILNKISQGEIQPTSAWYFITRDYILYILTGLSILLGSLAVSSVLFQIVFESGPGTAMRPGPVVTLKAYMYTIPWLWLVLFVILVLAAWLNYRHTRGAYKQHNIYIVAVVLLVSALGGVMLFKSGMAQIFESHMRSHVPAYGSYIDMRDMKRIEYFDRNNLGTPPRPPHMQRVLAPSR